MIQTPEWRKERRGITSIRPHETNIYVREGAIYIYMKGVRRHKILNEKIMAAVGMKAGKGRGVGSSAGLGSS
jgi:hypothetical protein